MVDVFGTKTRIGIALGILALTYAPISLQEMVRLKNRLHHWIRQVFLYGNESMAYPKLIRKY